jgi:transcriptional regulator with XRE-family HTH domain
MTQDEFAAVSNMGGRTIISKYEMGIRVPSVINGLRIAKTLGMSMDELFGDKG